jgi:hypothetical protein
MVTVNSELGSAGIRFSPLYQYPTSLENRFDKFYQVFVKILAQVSATIMSPSDMGLVLIPKRSPQ